jgi:multicomponent Na+:H+ antiporter subunit D
MISFTLASLAMVGTPAFVAFISKWHLAVASLETGHLILVFVLIVSSLLNALYYYPVAVNAFFPGKKHGESKKAFTLDEIPLSMLSTTALLAFFCLFFGLMRPNWPVIMASRIAAMLF